MDDMEGREANALASQLRESRVGVASLEAIVLVRRDRMDAIVGIEAEDVRWWNSLRLKSHML
ncbi:MAG: hypothetical protein AAGF11_55635 [Myxococcota bacterium]